MRLKLIFRDDEKHDELDRRVVEGVKIASWRRSSKRAHYFLKPVGGTMRNGDSESNACAHCFLTLFQRSEDGIAVFRFNFTQTNEKIDQLNDGGPALRGFHLRDDLLDRKEIGQRHANPQYGRECL